MGLGSRFMRLHSQSYGATFIELWATFTQLWGYMYRFMGLHSWSYGATFTVVGPA